MRYSWCIVAEDMEVQSQHVSLFLCDFAAFLRLLLR